MGHFSLANSEGGRWTPLRVLVSQADGWPLLVDVQAMGLFAGSQNSGYSRCYYVPHSNGYQLGPDRVVLAGGSR